MGIVLGQLGLKWFTHYPPRSPFGRVGRDATLGAGLKTLREGFFFLHARNQARLQRRPSTSTLLVARNTFLMNEYFVVRFFFCFSSPLKPGRTLSLSALPQF